MRHAMGSVLWRVVCPWLPIEFGGESGEQVLGIRILVGFAAWAVRWPGRRMAGVEAQPAQATGRRLMRPGRWLMP